MKTKVLQSTLEVFILRATTESEVIAAKSTTHSLDFLTPKAVAKLSASKVHLPFPFAYPAQRGQECSFYGFLAHANKKVSIPLLQQLINPDAIVLANRSKYPTS